MTEQMMILIAGPRRMVGLAPLEACRIGGPSSGADDIVATGQKLGKRIFRDLSEVPERRR